MSNQQTYVMFKIQHLKMVCFKKIHSKPCLKMRFYIYIYIQHQLYLYEIISKLGEKNQHVKSIFLYLRFRVQDDTFLFFVCLFVYIFFFFKLSWLDQSKNVGDMVFFHKKILSWKNFRSLEWDWAMGENLFKKICLISIVMTNQMH